MMRVLFQTLWPRKAFAIVGFQSKCLGKHENLTLGPTVYYIQPRVVARTYCLISRILYSKRLDLSANSIDPI